MSGIIKRLALALAMLFATGIVYSAPAAAQATRTWVSGVGDDANPCSRTAPCKTFAGAISKTADGGEINCIDPGGFGAVTITKSITIDCTEVEAGVVVAGTNGVIINGGPTTYVKIRGVDFMGTITVPGLNGIRIIAGKSLVLDRVVISGFSSGTPNGYGVYVNPGSGDTHVTIVNSIISNNTNGGVSVAPTGTATASLTISNSQFIDNGGFGILLTNANSGTGAMKLNVDSSVVSSTVAGASGIVFKTPAGNATGSVSGSTVTDNPGYGVRITGGTLFVGSSKISGNGTGVDVGGGTMTSLGNNQLVGNGVNGSFSGTTPPN